MGPGASSANRFVLFANPDEHFERTWLPLSTGSKDHQPAPLVARTTSRAANPDSEHRIDRSCYWPISSDSWQ